MKVLLKSNQVGHVTPLGRSASVLGRSNVRAADDVNCSDALDSATSLRPGTGALRGFQTRNNAAFTMVEIALSLAIIGFALVAIIGVLPAGLNVQRNNREETIINQESGYFMDALRSGARGLDELTNRIINITNHWTVWDTTVSNWSVVNANHDWYTNTKSRVTSAPLVVDDAFTLVDGYRVISLLSRPKFEQVGAGRIRSNHVVAFVRAIAGAATEKMPQATPSVLDLGFSYRMLVEIHDVPLVDRTSGQAQSLSTNLHEVRLRFSWPLLPAGKIGTGRQTFRSMAGGQHQTFPEPMRYPPEPASGHPIFFFTPSVY